MAYRNYKVLFSMNEDNIIELCSQLENDPLIHEFKQHVMNYGDSNVLFENVYSIFLNISE